MFLDILHLIDPSSDPPSPPEKAKGVRASHPTDIRTHPGADSADLARQKDPGGAWVLVRLCACALVCVRPKVPPWLLGKHRSRVEESTFRADIIGTDTAVILLSCC